MYLSCTRKMAEEKESKMEESTKEESSSGTMRFEIKKWNAVTMWSWDICADTCAICRNSLNEPSIEYQVRIYYCMLYHFYVLTVYFVQTGKSFSKQREWSQHSLRNLWSCVSLGLHPALAENKKCLSFV